MSDHAWCSDPARDEAVRAVEDGRMGPLPTLEECIETARAMMPKELSGSSAPEPENTVNGMRTERVTLEITMRAESYAPCRDLDWQRMLRQTPGGLFPGESVRVVEEVRLPPTIIRLTDEREAARRERDEAKEECERLLAERDEATGRCKMLLARVAELESAAAANAGGEQQEPVAWMATKPGDDGGYQRCLGWDRHNVIHGIDLDASSQQVSVSPLYAAPQPPRGWLTEGERRLIERLKESSEAFPPSMKYIDDVTVRDALAIFDALLARSTPPRVKVPKYFPMSWAHERDDAWIAAIREAGVEVEVE